MSKFNLYKFVANYSQFLQNPARLLTSLLTIVLNKGRERRAIGRTSIAPQSVVYSVTSDVLWLLSPTFSG